MIDPQKPTSLIKAKDVVFDETSFIRSNLSHQSEKQFEFFSSSPSEPVTTNTFSSPSRPLRENVAKPASTSKHVEETLSSPLSLSENAAEISTSNKVISESSSSNSKTETLLESSFEDEEISSSSNYSSSEDIPSLSQINKDDIAQVIPELFEENAKTSSDTQERLPRNRNPPSWTSDYVMLNSVNDTNQNMFSNNLCVPQTVNQALKSPESELWVEAMNKELNSFKINDAWEIADKQLDQKLLGTKWVFKTKSNPDGHQTNKARLVIKGCAQRYGVDYLETFSPVVRHATLRLLFALSAYFNLKFYHFDVMNTFLHGELNEQIYIKPPEGLTVPKDKVLR